MNNQWMKVIVSFWLCIGILQVIYPNQSLADKLPIEAYSQLPSVEKFRISPSGNKIVYIRNTIEKGVSFIVMIDIANNEKRVLGMTDNRGEFFKWLRWVNDDIILGSVSIKTHRKGKLYQETRLNKYYADGKKKAGNAYSPIIYKWARSEWRPTDQDNIIDWLSDDPEHVIFQMKIHDVSYPSVFKLNVQDGSIKLIKRANNKINDWMTDRQHNVRLGISGDYKNKKTKILINNLLKDKWEILWEYKMNSINSIHPKGFDLDGNKLYFTKYHDGRLALFIKDLTTLKETLVFSDPQYDVTGRLIHSPKTRGVVGIYHHHLPTGRYYLDPVYKEEQKRIDAILTKTNNYQVSTSDDLNTYIVYSDAHNIPGTYYLGKKKQNTMMKLFPTYPNLTPEHMVGSKKVTYTARDGTDIEAYLSVPKGIDKPIATVIYPHGGPASRDYGVFDVWSEYFVNLGYAVLRPNFRGSSGYGYEFSMAQNKSWGKEMQDDITDGVRWLVDNKITDPDNVCIYGASYGGYAALMGAVKTPDLFKCAISYAGVSDLVYLKNKYRQTDAYKLVKDQLGEDEEAMKNYSPIFRVDEIQIPVLLMHGTDDNVVRVEHSRLMVEALEKASKDYKYIEFPDEYHGLLVQVNRTKAFQEVGNFLDKYLTNH